MKVFVTGATGFIGSAATRALCAAGHEVIALHRGTTLPAWAAREPQCAWVSGDMANPPVDEIASHEPDALIHCAWIATPGVYLESEENETLRRDSLALLTALARRGVRHHTVLGTCIEYRMTGKPLVENETPLAPISRYARAKNALRCDLEAVLPSLGCTLAWARIFYPYGVDEHPQRLCSSLIRTLGAGEPLRLKTPESTKDYIHVRDVALALKTLAESAAVGPFNVGTGVGVTVQDLALTIAAQLGRPELVIAEPTGQTDPYGYVVASTTRLAALGWEPKVSLAEGIAEMVGRAAA